MIAPAGATATVAAAVPTGPVAASPMQCVVVKAAPPHLASRPDIALSPARMRFEAAGLRDAGVWLSELIMEGWRIGVPAVMLASSDDLHGTGGSPPSAAAALAADDAHAGAESGPLPFVIMQDCGPQPDLATWVATAAGSVAPCARALSLLGAGASLPPCHHGCASCDAETAGHAIGAALGRLHVSGLAAPGPANGAVIATRRAVQ